ncbi:hypothetical protein Grass_251 [Bacillus phage Grass]|uniref:Uncharacterized protein n=1 Tax=Bacillus phage Grass TaxID=1406785 RepID=U5PUU8_BPGRA|nr:hypothetical protein Grass_10 [Bacillus phage Grass]YP_008771617.1 hypothetical protein Grass_251 [Bacillus phage Grass]AGY47275.1 hypothetical protein Grass_10 [Bacillus phage Grass]AGY47516.1 hypothetical protein Grass_251 [Bacillus phage Grass]
MNTLHMNTWAVEELMGHVDGVSFEEGTAKLEAIVKHGSDHVLTEIERYEDKTYDDLFREHFEAILKELAFTGREHAVKNCSITSIPYYSVRYILELKAEQMLEGYHGWCDHEIVQEEVNGSFECFSYCVKCGQEV